MEDSHVDGTDALDETSGPHGGAVSLSSLPSGRESFADHYEYLQGYLQAKNYQQRSSKQQQSNDSPPQDPRTLLPKKHVRRRNNRRRRSVQTLLEPQQRPPFLRRSFHKPLNLLPLILIPRANDDQHLRRRSIPFAQLPDRPPDMTGAKTRTLGILHIHLQRPQHQLVDLAHQRHLAQVQQLPLQLVVDVCPPLGVSVRGRVGLLPL